MTSSYNENQLYSNYPDGIENHYWNLSRNQIIKAIINKYNLSDKTILEIGCGRGVVVQYLTEHDINCYGADLAKGDPIKPNPKVFLGTDASAIKKEIRDSIDVLMLLDVIEHIEYPSAFLKDIKSHYPNARYMIVAVPARQEIWSNYDEFYGHYRRYDKKKLLDHISILNPRVLKIKYIYFPLYLMAQLFRLMKIKRKVDLKAPLSGFANIIHALMAKLFYAGFKFNPGMPRGTSIITLFELEL